VAAREELGCTEADRFALLVTVRQVLLAGNTGTV